LSDEDAHWELSSQYKYLIPVISHITDMIFTKQLDISFQQLAFDLREISYNQFHYPFPRYFLSQVTCAPTKFLVKKAEFVEKLIKLREKYKIVLVTPVPFSLVDTLLASVLEQNNDDEDSDGKSEEKDDWRILFDHIIVSSQPALFC